MVWCCYLAVPANPNLYQDEGWWPALAGVETCQWSTTHHLDPPDFSWHGCYSDWGPAASGGQTVLANNRNSGRLRLIASRHYYYLADSSNILIMSVCLCDNVSLCGPVCLCDSVCLCGPVCLCRVSKKVKVEEKTKKRKSHRDVDEVCSSSSGNCSCSSSCSSNSVRDARHTLCLQKTHQLWNGIARNYKDEFRWNFA